MNERNYDLIKCFDFEFEQGTKRKIEMSRYYSQRLNLGLAIEQNNTFFSFFAS